MLKENYGEISRNDGRTYEFEASAYFLKNQNSDITEEIVNYLNIDNALRFDLEDSSKLSNIDNEGKKSRSKVDSILNIKTKNKNFLLNCSFKKNFRNGQLHITTGQRFIDLVNSFEANFFNNDIELFKISLFKFLGSNGYSPEELNETKKTKRSDRYGLNELSEKENESFQFFFKNKDNIKYIVRAFLLGEISESTTNYIVDAIIFNKTNFNKKNNYVVNPDIIFSSELFNYLEKSLEDNDINDLIKIKNTTIHFFDIFSIQRKGSGSKTSKSGLQIKYKNLKKLKEILLQPK